MSRTVPYSAEQDDFYYPAKRAVFFAGGRPESDAVLCAELSRLAYCRMDFGFAFDRDRIRKVLGAVGFSGCQFFESEGPSEGRGTHCFLASDAASELSVIVFRGTDQDDPTDLCDDLDVGLMAWPQGGRAHTGFANALADVLTDLEPAVTSAPGRILYAGHNLGAALATLLASLRAPKAVYTFGSPQVGDAAFVASLAGVENYRYVNCCDIVTRVPPTALDYEHVGDPYYIDRDGNITFHPANAVVCADRMEAAAEYLTKYSWRIGDVAVRELADHAPVNYVYAVT